MGVRDALNRLDSELLAPRSLAEIKKLLADEKTRIEETKNAEHRALAVMRAQLGDGAGGENQCEHKGAPHHARGLCRPCYIALRRATM